MIQQLIDWLDATAISQLFKETSWVVPVVQSVHILAIAVVLGGAVALGLRLARLNARHIDIPTFSERLLPVLWWATAVLLVTGTLLIVTEPTRTLNNSFFYAKMACLLLLVPLTRWFQLAVRKQPARWRDDSVSSLKVRPAVAFALTLLVAIVFCGRWIGYV